MVYHGLSWYPKFEGPRDHILKRSLSKATVEYLVRSFEDPMSRCHRRPRERLKPSPWNWWMRLVESQTWVYGHTMLWGVLSSLRNIFFWLLVLFKQEAYLGWWYQFTHVQIFWNHQPFFQCFIVLVTRLMHFTLKLRSSNDERPTKVPSEWSILPPNEHVSIGENETNPLELRLTFCWNDEIDPFPQRKPGEILWAHRGWTCPET